MNDQSNLPSWLPLQEAAQYLEAKLGLTVDAVAILEVARTGHLQLSVSLPRPVMARRVKPGSLSPSILNRAKRSDEHDHGRNAAVLGRSGTRSRASFSRSRTPRIRRRGVGSDA